eukprot:TRINITY_DN9385_c0_g1_i2.p1 TRINITY_DN9385_c0_g1~~TRINITY_DN9385_c0_g1_i2.p1  ORF type:complete len:298 (+),score=58.99 TRINITY_DN9385_c0_g1_i2:254-1147(+)
MMNPEYDVFGDTNSEFDTAWAELALNRVSENPEEHISKVDTFKEQLKVVSKGQDFEDKIDETQMIRFLRAGNWDLKHSMAIFLHHMEHTRKFLPYMGGSGFPSEIEHVYREKLVWVSPYRDHQGRRVLLLRLGKWNPDTITSKQLYTATSHLFQIMSFEPKTQVSGIVILGDLVGFGMKQLGSLGLEEMKCCGDFLSGGFPLWVRRLLFINNPKVFDILFSVLNPFLGERIKNHVKFCGNDIAKLLTELPKEVLPEDLQGTSSEKDFDASMKAVKDMEQKLKDNLANTEKLSKIFKK